tara:strand:+ start:4038 stop:4259 length:222 start_codon:yes stop_codon:yes gene_type:complete
VTVVDEVLKVLGRTIPARWSVVAQNLVSPRLVERVLGDGEQLEMGVSHIECIVDEVVSEVVIVEGVAVGIPYP